MRKRAAARRQDAGNRESAELRTRLLAAENRLESLENNGNHIVFDLSRT